MNWRQELTLICLSILAARGISKWFGDGVLMALVGVGLAVVIGSRVRDSVLSQRAKKERASPQP